MTMFSLLLAQFNIFLLELISFGYFCIPRVNKDLNKQINKWIKMKQIKFDISWKAESGIFSSAFYFSP